MLLLPRRADLYYCPASKSRHHWLINQDDSRFSDASMGFELTAYCRDCGFDVSLDGELADWMQEKFLKANLELQKRVMKEELAGKILRTSPPPWTPIPSSEDPREAVAKAMRKSGFFEEDEILEYEDVVVEARGE